MVFLRKCVPSMPKKGKKQIIRISNKQLIKTKPKKIFFKKKKPQLPGPMCTPNVCQNENVKLHTSTQCIRVQVPHVSHVHVQPHLCGCKRYEKDGISDLFNIIRSIFRSQLSTLNPTLSRTPSLKVDRLLSAPTTGIAVAYTHFCLLPS